jgi:fructose-1,6-bisphosphatase/inositol monophosphatase family enzyme
VRTPTPPPFAGPPGGDAADGALGLLDEVAVAVRAALAGVEDWGLAGTKSGQHHSDLAADAAALGVLERADVGVLSEESGLQRPERDLLVVVDPLDGSTNAQRGIPWFAVSLCAVDAHGPLASLVVNLVDGTRFDARRGAGARRDGVPIRPSGVEHLRSAVIGLSGFPARYLGWSQYRALGAAALDLCLVACGAIDGYIDCSRDAHGVWDYLGGALVCAEAGAVVGEALGRDLLVRDPGQKRTPVAAATPALLDELLAARASY